MPQRHYSTPLQTSSERMDAAAGPRGHAGHAPARRLCAALPISRNILTRRLERAAALLHSTDRPIAEVCLAVGLRSIGSFTTSFTRAYGVPPAAYRAAHPPTTQLVPILTCM